MTGVTLRQLQYFVALAETGHYRRAAEREGISQSSLSQQISNLEESLNLSLVERGSAGALLTPEGREVLTRAREIAGSVRALADLNRRPEGEVTGTLRLGSSPTLGPYLLPYVLRDLHERHPDLKLIIREAAPRDLLEGLRTGEHDMILVQLPLKATDVVVERLFREPLHLVCAPDHALAGKDAVLDADLDGEEFLALPAGFTLHDQVIDIAFAAGANVNSRYIGTSLDALRQMASMNMGLTFLPALYVDSEVTKRSDDVVVLPFRKNTLTRSVGMSWRRSSREHIGYRVLIQAIRSAAATHFGELIQMEA